jgi:hypothetical protein
MTFRIDQLQEVRTAPAAHVMAHPQEGPVAPSSRRSWLAKQARVWGSLGAEGASAATVARPNGYALETGDAACDGWGWPKGGIEAWLLRMLGSMRGYRLKVRKGNDRREVPGGSGGTGGRPEAAVRVGGRRQSVTCATRAGPSPRPYLIIIALEGWSSSERIRLVITRWSCP